MLRNAASLGLVHRNFTIAMARVIVLSFIAFPFAGCGADGQGGPIISSLSAPTDDAQSGDGAPSDSNPTAAESPEVEHPTMSMLATSTDSSLSAAEDFEPAAVADSAEGEEDPTISVASTPSGATARLTWDAHPDPNVAGYSVYYGKQSSGEPGSCSYEESQSVESPPAIITGLDPNTPYFFAISAHGGEGSESVSFCSNEVLVVTPPAQG